MAGLEYSLTMKETPEEVGDLTLLFTFSDFPWFKDIEHGKSNERRNRLWFESLAGDLLMIDLRCISESDVVKLELPDVMSELYFRIENYRSPFFIAPCVLLLQRLLQCNWCVGLFDPQTGKTFRPNECDLWVNSMDETIRREMSMYWRSWRLKETLGQ